MKDAILTCCRDEADIIETFIRFYLRMGFDEIYVVDNGSVDGTTEIIEDLITTGVPVQLHRDSRLGYERYLTEYYLWAGNQSQLRWLFFLDADEFILFPDGAKRYFADLDPAVNCLRLRQREMYPALTSQQMPKIRDAFLLTTRTEMGFNDTTKDVSQFDEHAHILAGKHRIDRPEKRSLTVVDIFIRHYRYRIPDQARRKESNRVQAHRTYAREELEHISAFGPDVSLQWFQLCRERQEAESWREFFTPAVLAVEDRELAEWTITSGFFQRKANVIEPTPPVPDIQGG